MLFAFQFHYQYFCQYVFIHQLQLQAYIHENKDHSYSLKHYIEFCIFSPSNVSIIEFIIVCSLVLIISYNLNPNFFKKNCMIYLFYNPLLFLMLYQYVKIFYLIVLLVYLLIHICIFCIFCCLRWLVNFYGLIFLLYSFHLAIMH